MRKVAPVYTRDDILTGHYFECPGCGRNHFFDSRWWFNGNLERPTFKPSLISIDPDHEICHFYLTAGEIRFLNDCTHAMRGKTIELKEI